jgi:hypothetical protein
MPEAFNSNSHGNVRGHHGTGFTTPEGVEERVHSGEGLFYDPFWITAQRKSLAALRAATGFIVFKLLQKQAFDVFENNKALALSRQGFFFVAEEGFEPPTFGL